IGDNKVTAPFGAMFDAMDLSAIIMQLVLEGKELGVVSAFSEPGTKFTGEHLELFKVLNEPFAIALMNSLRYRELQTHKDRLVEDNRFLQGELRRVIGEEVIGAEFGLRGVMELVRQVAALDSPVLLLGETGTGKELIASTIHSLSFRRTGPFVSVNCGAIPVTLIDSELFGHERGAFTGAISRRRGYFERAHEGTVFLDEVGELVPEAQVRLLRVLQAKEIERVGGAELVKVDIRVIAATNRDLEIMLAHGQFREDLFFRLNIFPIVVPPLRERVMDIPALTQHFILKKSRELKLAGIPALTPTAIEHLMAYQWPGNVRELENAVERALILSKGEPLTFESLQIPKRRPDPYADGDGERELMKLDAIMARYIRKALTVAGGKVEGGGGAAELLGINPRTLRNRMKKLGVPFGRKARA
ncbi:MAG: sigma 54-interacting transcriptional regulator, partial [Candidatus Lindowbacteria bacterium]|nr:sigma 54-interacting transcriptional regulator [Candidatus Lindowbacteria bacterium]